MRCGAKPGSSRPPVAAGRCLASGTLLLLFVASSARAAELNGGYSYLTTSSDNQGFETGFEEQQASVSLFQKVTPYVSLRFGFQYSDFNSEADDGTEFSRRSRSPRLDLLYGRQRISARLSVRERTTDGSAVADNFESKALSANVSWRPSRGPGWAMGFRDDSNVADVGVFGRDTDSQFLTLQTFYDRAWGGLRYSFSRNRLDNRSSGFESRQNRHQVHANAVRSFLANRVSIDFATSVSRLDRKTGISGEPDLAEPVPALQGLFAVDTSPEIGELPSAPGLVDGDTETPAAPGIDIGGANTYRNLGLDLGVKSQASRLEVNVDTVSGPDVLWEVYASPDNLFWERLAGVVSEYDNALLRYTLRFPQVTERYFKAVNVSVNAEPSVRVTEVRALLDVGAGSGLSEFESTLYRADVGASFRPGRRTTGRVELGFSNDEDVSAGLVRRDFEERHASARMTTKLTDELRLSLGYTFNDSDNGREPKLLRTEQGYNASLRWAPLPTVNAVLSAQRRDERQEGELLQSSRTARLLVSTTILPDLRLTSDVTILRIDDPFSGFDRSGWVWRETLSARPVRRLLLGAFYHASSYEDASGADVLNRTNVGFSSTWSATAYLVLGGSWSLGREAGRENVSQSYRLSWAPGPKLSLSAGYQEFETLDGEARGTASDNVGLNYRMSNRLAVFGSLSRSRSEKDGVETDEFTSLRAGLRLVI